MTALRSDIAIACRLCHGETEHLFDAKILLRHNARFLRCTKCGSLQAADPFWLTEAYSETSLASDDTGGAIRGLMNFAAVKALILCRIIAAGERIVDYGGGSGLLCRLLRDAGYNAWTLDAHATPEFALRYSVDSVDGASMVTAFEVVEHLPEPANALGEVFAAGPKVLLLSTELYRGQDTNWWFFNFNHGQHIFFYTDAAMRWLAKKHGYHYYSICGFHVFLRQELRRIRRRLLGALLRPFSLRMILCLRMAFLTSGHAARDSGMFDDAA